MPDALMFVARGFGLFTSDPTSLVCGAKAMIEFNFRTEKREAAASYTAITDNDDRSTGGPRIFWFGKHRCVLDN